LVEGDILIVIGLADKIAALRTSFALN